MLADGSSFLLPLSAASQAPRCIPEAIAGDRHSPKPLSGVCTRHKQRWIPHALLRGLCGSIDYKAKSAQRLPVDTPTLARILHRCNMLLQKGALWTSFTVSQQQACPCPVTSAPQVRGQMEELIPPLWDPTFQLASNALMPTQRSQHSQSPLLVNRHLHFSCFWEERDKRRKGGQGLSSTPLCCISRGHRCTASSQSSWASCKPLPGHLLPLSC